MCQYSSNDGHVTDWQLVHLGGLARGGAALVMTEAVAVVPEGRTTALDAGIWTDDHATDFVRITEFVRSQGAVPGIQLAHAGRKASLVLPWWGSGPLAPEDGGWPTVGPSPIGYGDWPIPKGLSCDEIAAVVRAWAAGARRALDAGFEVLEIHAAHGYLLHEFLSPLSNHRMDHYGGDLAGRMRLLVEVVDAIRAVWPETNPLFVRVSASDWIDGGVTVDEVAEVALTLAGHGVDLIDVSSAGTSPAQRIDLGPGYQVPFAREIRRVSGLPVGAVGLITEPTQAEAILAAESADVIFLGRALMREPTWPQRAALELGEEGYWPHQYRLARPTRVASALPNAGRDAAVE